MNGIALAISAHVVHYRGELRCAGLFHGAINLLTSEGQLLTLHRQGRGLSPVGWTLCEDDFLRVFTQLQRGAVCRLTAEGLVTGDRCIRPPARSTHLNLSSSGEVSEQSVQAALSNVTADTGLFGNLREVVSLPPEEEVRQIAEKFQRWLRGGAVDWGCHTGKGPGLTPSNDDTLLGMLLCAWFDRRIDPHRLPLFFAHSRPLEQLTTLVSASYLDFAQRGIFATPLQRFAAALSDRSALPTAVNALLELGHYSGADTLLGIWLAAQIIDGCTHTADSAQRRYCASCEKQR